MKETVSGDLLDDVLIDHSGIFEHFSDSGTSQCHTGPRTTVFSNEFVSTDDVSDWKLITYEEEAYGVDMQHNDDNEERSWKLRLGNGGQMMSLILQTGESLANQRLAHARWNDLVQQMVAVNLDNNTAADCFIHGSGVYSRADAGTVDPPFYNPLLAVKCEDDDCAMINWGQQAHVPMKWHSPILYYTRYRNCGKGLIQYDMAMYNFGFQNPTKMKYDYFNTPWTGVRSTTFPDVLLSDPTTKKLETLTPIWTWGNNGPQLKNLKDTGGFTTFAENVVNEPEFELPFCVDEGLTYPQATQTSCYKPSPNNNELKDGVVRFQFEVQSNEGISVTSHWDTFSLPEGTTFKLPWCNASRSITYGNYMGWGRMNRTVTITNPRDVSITSRNSIHFCWQGFSYLQADTTKEFLEENFIAGDVLTINYTPTPSTPWDAQNALTFVHGQNEEYGQGGDFWRARSRLRVGTTDYGRDGTVFTTNFMGNLKPGDIYFNRKYLITDKLSQMEFRGESLIHDTEETVYTAGAFGSGTTITLWKDDEGMFGATVGDTTTSCTSTSTATNVCEGKSTPNSDTYNKPLFYSVCSTTMKFVSHDPYVNTDNGLTDANIIAAYQCKTTASGNTYDGRAKWKLLGYFTDGSCNALYGGGYTYDSDFCNAPTDPPIDPPTDPPIDPPTDPPIDPPTDPPIDPPTDPPIDPPTDPPIDPPTDPPTFPDVWSDIFFEDFENYRGNDTEGNFAYKKKWTSSRHYRSGTQGIRIRKRQSLKSRRFRIDTFSELRVDFYYLCKRLDEGQSFNIEFKQKRIWKKAEEWKFGKHFQNDEWSSGSVTVPTEKMHSKTRFRFNVAGDSNRDRIFFDDINFSGLKQS